MDYKMGKVYTSKNLSHKHRDSSQPRSRPQTVSFNLTSTDDEAHHSSNSTAEEFDFLGPREKRQSLKPQVAARRQEQGKQGLRQNQREEGGEEKATKPILRSNRGTQ